MMQRGWFVPVVAELSPYERNVMGWNVNRGQKIAICLRWQNDQSEFFPLEMIVDIMLHEMTHIVCGPHDERFFKLYYELHEEFDRLNSHRPFTRPKLALELFAARQNLKHFDAEDSCKTISEGERGGWEEHHVSPTTSRRREQLPSSQSSRRSTHYQPSSQYEPSSRRSSHHQLPTQSSHRSSHHHQPSSPQHEPSSHRGSSRQVSSSQRGSTVREKRYLGGLLRVQTIDEE
ncbi:MAG: hypothetical protein Q9191_002345 [Dirinaria sp. TL-2023a]